MKTDSQIIIVPPKIMKILAGGLFVLAIFSFKYFFINADDITLKEKVLYRASSIILSIIAIDYIQRKYCFSRDQIQVRFLYFWKKYLLPARLELWQNDVRQVIFQDAVNGKEIISIPNDYSNHGQLFANLQEFYRDKL